MHCVRISIISISNFFFTTIKVISAAGGKKALGEKKIPSSVSIQNRKKSPRFKNTIHPMQHAREKNATVKQPRKSPPSRGFRGENPRSPYVYTPCKCQKKRPPQSPKQMTLSRENDLVRPNFRKCWFPFVNNIYHKKKRTRMTKVF